MADGVQWTTAGVLSEARTGHTATLLDDGRVLVTGGFDDTITFDSVDLYNAGTNTWFPSDPMIDSRAGHSATLLLDGTVLVAGGVNDQTTLASAELFDPTTGAWSPVAALAVARHGHTASLLADGTVLVAGGTDDTGAPLASAERYDPGTGEWTAAADMRVARRYHTAIVVRPGTLIVAGGQGIAQPLDAVERYDYARDIWIDLAPLATPRMNHAAAALADGALLVVGGISVLDEAVYEATAERYDPSADAWSPATPIPYARANHSATTLLDGSVLVTGGFNSTVGLLDDSQRYLPASNTWEPTGALVIGRERHVATLLADGDVLVTGGRAGTSLTSAERYPQNDPPVARPPIASLRLGALGTTVVPVSVSWPSALDADGIDHYQLQQQDNGAGWTAVPLASSTSQSVALQLRPGHGYRFRVRATDILAATGYFATSVERQLELRQESGSGISYTGPWSPVNSPAYSGGAVRRAIVTGAAVTVRFSGASVAWVSGKGAGRGRARVVLDGVIVATIDLYAPTTRSRQIVFARNGLISGVHTLKIVVLGTKNSASAGTRVDLDAVIVFK